MGLLTGKLLVPSAKLDLTQGPAAILDPVTGATTSTIPSTSSLVDDVVPYAEAGAVGPTGTWCIQYEDDITGRLTGVAFYDSDNKFLRSDDTIFPLFNFPHAYIAATNDAFWVLAYDGSGGEDGSLYKYDLNGNFLSSTIEVLANWRSDWPTDNPSEHTIDGFAVSYDNATMYMYQGTFAPAEVFTYQIGTDTWDAAALFQVAARRADSVDIINSLALVHGGDTIAIGLRPQFGSGSLNKYLRLYDRLTGTAIGAERDFGVGGDPLEMGVQPTDADAFYVKYMSSDDHTYTLYKLDPTDLTDLQTPAGPFNTLENGGDVPASCPLLYFPPATDEGIEPPSVRGPSEECCPCEENPQPPAPGQSPTDSAAPLPSVTGAILPPTFTSVMAWVPSCAGGGDVPTAADATDAESWVS